MALKMITKNIMFQDKVFLVALGNREVEYFISNGELYIDGDIVSDIEEI